MLNILNIAEEKTREESRDAVILKGQRVISHVCRSSALFRGKIVVN